MGGESGGKWKVLFQTRKSTLRTFCFSLICIMIHQLGNNCARTLHLVSKIAKENFVSSINDKVEIICYVKTPKKFLNNYSKIITLIILLFC